jgi:hypothetical protein
MAGWEPKFFELTVMATFAFSLAVKTRRITDLWLTEDFKDHYTFLEFKTERIEYGRSGNFAD